VVLNRKLAGITVCGVIAQLEAVPGPALIIVVKAVAVAPISTERLSGNTAATSAILVLPHVESEQNPVNVTATVPPVTLPGR
jgi:hypothetical protein